jgi:uncharacterized protein
LAEVGKPLVVGDWQGSIETGHGNLKVVIHIAAGKEDTFTGTLDSPDQGATGIPINVIQYKHPELHFEIERLDCGYDGKISNDGSEISGLFKQSGGSASLNFRRVNK